MKTPLFVSMFALAGAFVAPRAAVGQDQFIIDVTHCTLGTQEIFNAVGEGNDPASIVNLNREQACAAGDREQYVAKVRGQKVLMAMEEGKMSVDYGNPDDPRFTMYDPVKNIHATWTGKELEALMNQMMGGAQAAAGQRGAMADAILRARAAMGGGGEQEVEGLYDVNSLIDCDEEAFGAHQGEVGFDHGNPNPMQKNWKLIACVSNKHPNALRTFRAMQEATNQFESMGGEKEPIDQKEDELAEKGLPIDVRRLTQSGGFTAGLNYDLNFFRLEEASVSASDVNAAQGTEVPLQEYLASKMSHPDMMGRPGR